MNEFERTVVATLERTAERFEGEPDFEDLQGRRRRRPVSQSERTTGSRRTFLSAAAVLLAIVALGAMLVSRTGDGDTTLEAAADPDPSARYWLKQLPEQWEIIESTAQPFPPYWSDSGVLAAVAPDHRIVRISAVDRDTSPDPPKVRSMEIVNDRQIGVVSGASPFVLLAWNHEDVTYFLEAHNLELEEALRIAGGTDGMLEGGAITDLAVELADEYEVLVDTQPLGPSDLPVAFRTQCPAIDAEHGCGHTITVQQPEYGSSRFERERWFATRPGQLLQIEGGEVLMGSGEADGRARLGTDLHHRT